jgi:hypothetical protein
MDAQTVAADDGAMPAGGRGHIFTISPRSDSIRLSRNHSNRRSSR